jgi:hypothetical protein
MKTKFLMKILCICLLGCCLFGCSSRDDDKTVDPPDTILPDDDDDEDDDDKIVVLDGEQLSSDRMEDTSGDQISILGWYGIPSGAGTRELYQDMRLAGFTHNFPTATSASLNETAVLADLNLAQAVGMKALVYAEMMNSSHPASFIKKLKEHPANGGYIVRDEPSNREFAQLRQQVQSIQAQDSEHPCYINLFSYGGAGEAYGINSADEFLESYLRPFIRDVPVPMISFDDYPVFDDQDGRHTIAPRTGGRTADGKPGNYGWYGALELYAQETKRVGKPLWAFALATAHPMGTLNHPIPTMDDLRLQVYSNLAYGAQCIQYFTYWTPPGGFHDGPVDKDGQKTATYATVQEMNREIIALSPVFLNAKMVWAAHTGEVPDALCTELKKEQLPDIIQSLDITEGKGALVSLLEKGNDHFLVIVNHDIVSDIKVQIKGAPALRRVRKDGLIVIPDYSKVWTVPPGDVLIYFWK